MIWADLLLGAMWAVLGMFVYCVLWLISKLLRWLFWTVVNFITIRFFGFYYAKIALVKKWEKVHLIKVSGQFNSTEMVRKNMAKKLKGSETNLVNYWKLKG